MSANKVHYSTHSRRTFMYHFILLNNRKYLDFNQEYFNDMMEAMKKTTLSEEVSSNTMRNEANILYRSFLGYI